MPTLKKKKSSEAKLYSVLPVTKGSYVYPPTPGPVETKKIVGVPLRMRINSEVYKIPAQLANKKIVKYFKFTPSNPFSELGDMSMWRFAGSGYENFPPSAWVRLFLPNMYYKQAFIQIEVLEYPNDNVPDFQVQTKNDQFDITANFPALPRDLQVRRKHFLSFFIGPAETQSWEIKITRRLNMWSLYSIEVFILETTL